MPLFAAESFWFAVLARIAIGASDACLMPACNSLITRSVLSPTIEPCCSFHASVMLTWCHECRSADKFLALSGLLQVVPAVGASSSDWTDLGRTPDRYRAECCCLGRVPESQPAVLLSRSRRGMAAGGEALSATSGYRCANRIRGRRWRAGWTLLPPPNALMS